MVGINPGELREKVEFYSVTRVSDGAGGFTGDQVLQFATFASIKPGKAQYTMQNESLSMDRPYDAVIRYSTSKMPKLDHILKYRGQEYRILEIRDVDVYRRFLFLTIARKG